MQVKVTPKKATSQVEINITLPAVDFAPYIKQAAKNISKEHPIAGFRPGTASIEVVKKHVGEQHLLTHAMEAALSKLFVRAVIENSIEAIGRPAIAVEQLGFDTDFRFTATVAVVPQVKLGDAKTLKAAKRAINVTDADITQELTYLAKLRSTQLEVPKPAATGDTVIVDFDVRLNGQPIEGGSSKNHHIHLGEGHFIPDFEQKLIGAKAGENRQFPVTFPADFASEEYRGKAADVSVTIHSVHKRLVPELNDDFARKLGKFTGLDHLKEELKGNMTREKEQRENERLRGELAEGLAAVSTFDPLPEVMIEKEIDHRLEEVNQLLAYQGKTMEQYLKEQNLTAEKLRATLREPAIKSLKASLVLRAFADAEKVTVPPEEVEKKAAEYMQRFTTLEQAQRAIDADDLKQNILNTLRNQEALKRLEELAQVTTVESKEKVTPGKTTAN